MGNNDVDHRISEVVKQRQAEEIAIPLLHPPPPGRVYVSSYSAEPQESWVIYSCSGLIGQDSPKARCK